MSDRSKRAPGEDILESPQAGDKFTIITSISNQRIGIEITHVDDVKVSHKRIMPKEGVSPANMTINEFREHYASCTIVESSR